MSYTNPLRWALLSSPGTEKKTGTQKGTGTCSRSQIRSGGASFPGWQARLAAEVTLHTSRKPATSSGTPIRCGAFNSQDGGPVPLYRLTHYAAIRICKCPPLSPPNSLQLPNTPLSAWALFAKLPQEVYILLLVPF